MDCNFEFAKFRPLIGLLIWLLVSMQNPRKSILLGHLRKPLVGIPNNKKTCFLTRAIVRSEGFYVIKNFNDISWDFFKIPMTPAGILNALYWSIKYKNQVDRLK